MSTENIKIWIRFNGLKLYTIFLLWIIIIGDRLCANNYTIIQIYADRNINWEYLGRTTVVKCCDRWSSIHQPKFLRAYRLVMDIWKITWCQLVAISPTNHRFRGTPNSCDVPIPSTQKKVVFPSIIPLRIPDTQPTVFELIRLAGISGGAGRKRIWKLKKLTRCESEVAFQRTDLNLNNRRVELIGYVRKN